MNASAIITRLERFPAQLAGLVRDLAPEEAGWRPPDEAWSLAEIVMHLADEETDDFRVRIEHTLRDSNASWPPIDPEGRAATRRSEGVRLGDALDLFVAERKRSIAWLKQLGDPNWATQSVHPKFGAMSAGDLLGAWAAHDALHLRQIGKRLYQLTARDAEPYRVAYAGPAP